MSRGRSEVRLSPAELELAVGAIEALKPPDKLRLAADLLEERRADVAHAIVRRIADELGLALEKRKGRL